MVGVGEARVLLLENEVEEALPVLRALAQRGIPAVWFTGRKGELPPADQPLRYVRLALLDVDLVGGGANKRAILSTLVGRVRRLLSPDAVGLGVVLWTKHSDYKEDFLDLLLQSGGPVPTFVEALPKAEFQNGGQFDVELLTARLLPLFAQTRPWPSLLSWEDEVRESAAAVVETLVRLSEGTRARPTSVAELAPWQENVQTALATLLVRMAAAEFGSLENGAEVVLGMTSALLPLLNDETEARIRSKLEELRPVGDELLAIGTAATLPKGTNAELNTRLNIGRTATPRAWTGNVYAVRRGPVATALSRSLGRRNFSDILITAVRQGGSPEKIQERENALRAGYIDTILIDVNPSCDHAQQRTQTGRLVAGARVRVAEYTSKNTKLPDYIYKLGPLRTPSGEEYLILVDLRTVFACDSGLLSKLTPIMRLRHIAAADLQSRLAAHGSRIGILTITGHEA